MRELLDRLRAIVGEANVIVDGRLEDYEHDGTFLQHGLQAAVLPATTEEVAAIVKACAETRTP
ncbi:MAG: hydroxyacid dehydrogenase, partial [Candidatus Dormibacteraeota bacterium]|nr:hydroxyacid dehydrogenase [Candidatus Dormibacteraeota bacterium]